MTQEEVDVQIDVCIGHAIKNEVKRDNQEYESPLYWKYHDISVLWHEKARKLMPKGS